MTETLDERYRRLLAKQLVMNEQTWRTLQSRGLSDHSEVRLDFAYVAPTAHGANSLRETLVERTDYDVAIEQSSQRSTWQVKGSTQLTAISLPILNEWVDWMITAGLHHDCEFDGWGCDVPV